ncbi:MAG TPA: hypothetical protein VFN57_06555 [Thermomicrobiaceae bacterium]|nr:hypothetical protein [Thermomicrobiaceae bacterium]
MADEITLADLNRIYVVIPGPLAGTRINVTAAEMTDRQFRDWIKAKADLGGVRMLVPMGRIGLETRVRMLNRLSEAGVRIYMTPRTR